MRAWLRSALLLCSTAGTTPLLAASSAAASPSKDASKKKKGARKKMRCNALLPKLRLRKQRRKRGGQLNRNPGLSSVSATPVFPARLVKMAA